MQRNSLLKLRWKLISCGISLCLAVLVILCGVGAAFAYQQPPNALPPSFKPPRKTPEFYQIEDPKITQDEFDTWKKRQLDYRSALGARTLDSMVNGEAAKGRIAEGIRLRVLRFSLKTERSQLKNRRRELIQDIDFNAKKDTEVRQFALQQVLEHSKSLLSNHFHVRLHIVFLLGQLDKIPEDISTTKKPAIPYAGSVPLLLSVLSETVDGKPVPQPEAVKIPAAHGLRRILNSGALPKQPNEKTRIAIARVLLAELDSKPAEAYEQVLLHTLAEVAIPLISPVDGGSAKPEIVSALARVMVDPTRSLKNRCRAARLLGRTPMPGGVNAAPITWGTIQIAQQIGAQYNKRVRKMHAIFYFQDLFLAYSPAQGTSTSDGKLRGGLLSTLKSPQTTEAFGVIKPVMVFSLRALMAKPPVAPETIPQPLLQAIGAIQKPASMVIWDGDPPIDQKKSRSPEERPGTPAG